MGAEPASVSMDFICSPQAVREAVSDASLYEFWHAGRGENLSERGEFMPGSKITLGESATGVVSANDPAGGFTVLFGQRREQLTAAAADFGCRVTMQVSDPDRPKTELLLWADAALERLKDAVYRNLSDTDRPNRKALFLPPRRHRRLRDVITGIISGYRSPLSPGESLMVDSDHISGIIDHTETDVIIHLRAALVSLMCTVMLFTTLGFAVRLPGLEQSVVPASGKSIFESEDVNKDNAERIYIGMTKNQLERMLSCVGVRLSATDFSYVSPADSNGWSARILLVSYDAYSKVRSVRFIDMVRAPQLLDLHMSSLRGELSTGMSAADVENRVGYPLTAFSMDKSRRIRVLFGTLDMYDDIVSPVTAFALFDMNTSSELVIDIDPARDSVGIVYNFPYDPDNPLSLTELGSELRLQYSNLQSYRNDRYALERIFFLYGKSLAECEIVLGPLGSLQLGEQDVGIFQLFSADAGEWYYLYEVTFDDNEMVTAVSLHNSMLEARADTFRNAEKYTVREGMTLYELAGAIGLLPGYASVGQDTLTLGYGRRTGTFEAADENPMKSYELCFQFQVPQDRLDLSGYLLTSWKINT